MTPRPRLTVAFDCDETLWLNGSQEPHGGKPNGKVIRLFLILQQLGCLMVVWSAGGVEWAKQICEYCDIEPDEIREKPTLEQLSTGVRTVDLAIDDAEDCGRLTLFV